MKSHSSKSYVVLNLALLPCHELVGELLSAEDVDGPGVVVGDEAAAAGPLLRLVVQPQPLPRPVRAGSRGVQRLILLRPQKLEPS